jgi:hypothetical protein
MEPSVIPADFGRLGHPDRRERRQKSETADHTVQFPGFNDQSRLRKCVNDLFNPPLK